MVAIAYPDEHRAEEVYRVLKGMKHELDLDDAVYVVRNSQGEVAVHQTQHHIGKGVTRGAAAGLLIGALAFVPGLGIAVGAGVGALAGKKEDYGINDTFIDQLSANLTPGSSALFLLVSNVTIDTVLPAVSAYGGTVIKTDLSKKAERQLKAALAADHAESAGDSAGHTQEHR
jgi:uncharacterized membrane protein